MLKLFEDVVTLLDRENIYKYQYLVQHAPDAIVAINADHRVTLWNPAAESLFGYFEFEVVGQDIAQLIIPPQFRKRYYDGVRRLSENGKSAEIYKTLEMMALRRDGSVFPVELSIFQSGYGRHQEFSAIIRDISERKDTEHKIHQYTHILEEAVVGISTLDTHGVYQSVNRAYATMLGYAPDELVGQPWQPGVYEDSLEAFLTAYQTMLKTGRAEVEAQGVRKDGSTFYQHVVMVKNTTKQGELLGHYCFMKDISDRKLLELELEDYNNKLETLVEQRTKQLHIALEKEHLLRSIVHAIQEEADLPKILEETVTKIGAFIEVERCVLWEYDASSQSFLPLQFEYRSSPDISSLLGTLPFFSDPDHPINHKQSFRINDLSTVAEVSPEDKQLINERQVKSVLQVPLCHKSNFFGVLRMHTVTYHREWSDDAMAVMQDIANQVSVAIHKAKLITELQLLSQELQEKYEREQLLRQLIQTIDTTLNVEAILEEAAKLVGTFFKVDRCILAINQCPTETGPGEKLVLSGYYYASSDIKEIHPEDIPTQQLLSTPPNDPQHPSLLVHFRNPEEFPPFYQEFGNNYHIQAAMGMGLEYRGTRYGRLVVHQCSSPRTWTDDEIALLEIVCAQLGIALAQSNLFHMPYRNSI